MPDFRQRICAVTVPYPGVRQWLEHGYKENLWDYVLLQDQSVVVGMGYEWIMFGAWNPAYNPIAAKAKAAGVKVAVAWSSSATEMEHAPVEIDAVMDLQRRGIVDAWLCLQPDMAGYFPNGRHLPAPVHLDPEPHQDEEPSGIGFYAPATLKKNIFPQLLAIQRVQELHPYMDLTLKTNLAPYKGVMEAYGIKHELQDWAPRDEHLARLSKCRMHMCASHAESFCYGAADAMMMGVPVVGSPTIDWLPDAWKTSNPNSPKAILEVMERHLSGYANPRFWINDVAWRNNAAASNTIRDLLAFK